MEGARLVDLNPENIVHYGVCGYKDCGKHVELQRKIDWFKANWEKGLRIRIVVSDRYGYQGMVEYMPGRYAYRPVEAEGYLFIQCLFVGFRKECKKKGYGSLLLASCIEEAKASGALGVAVVTRKGSFMADRRLFLEHGFAFVDQAPPDFSLLALSFHPSAVMPRFRPQVKGAPKQYGEDLTIFRSVQCPYTEKNVNAIMETARNVYHLEPHLIELEDAAAVQASPSPFGTFCIIFDGAIISHHPISNRRFTNIMNRLC